MASTTYEFLAHDDKHYKLWMTALGTVVKYALTVLMPVVAFAASVFALYCPALEPSTVQCAARQRHTLCTHTPHLL
jgi:hypothetical protein